MTTSKIRLKKRTNAFKLENEKISMRYRLSYFAAELELNSQNEIDVNCFKLRATRSAWMVSVGIGMVRREGT
jgi:hypothetical protein